MLYVDGWGAGFAVSSLAHTPPHTFSNPRTFPPWELGLEPTQTQAKLKSTPATPFHPKPKTNSKKTQTPQTPRLDAARPSFGELPVLSQLGEALGKGVWRSLMVVLTHANAAREKLGGEYGQVGACFGVGRGWVGGEGGWGGGLCERRLRVTRPLRSSPSPNPPGRFSNSPLPPPAHQIMRQRRNILGNIMRQVGPALTA